MMRKLLLILLLASVSSGANVTCDRVTCDRETISRNSTTNKTDLYLLIMAPYPNPILTNMLWDGGPALLPAARLAVEEVDNANILGDYQLKTLEMNSGCSLHGDEGTVGYIRNVYYNEHRRALVGAVGPACTDTDFIPEFIANKNPMVQVTVASSPALRNKTRFPYVLSTISSSKRIAVAVVKLAIERNWTRIGILLELTALFTELHDVLVSELKNYNIHFQTFEISSRQEVERYPLNAISSSKLRIMVVLATGPLMEKVLCEAYKHEGGIKLVYPAIQWILTFRVEHILYNNSRCSLNEVYKAFNKSLLVETSLKTDHNIITVTNQTFDDYKEDYCCQLHQVAKEYNITIEYNPYANLYYDAVWAFGRSLSNLLKDYNMYGYLHEDGMEYRRNFTETLIDFMYEMTPFGGASIGNVKFHNNTGEVQQVVNFIQLCGRNCSIPAVNLTSDNEMEVSNTAEFIEDEFETKNITDTLLMEIDLVIVTALIVLIVTILSFHILNVAYRSEKYVKASSPRLNHLIFTGSYMMSIGLLIYIGTESFFLGETKKILGIVLCYFYFILLEVGLALILSTVLVRTWRIYRIFLHFQKPGGWTLTDPALICTSFLLLIPVLFNIIMTAKDNFKWNIRNNTRPTINNNVFIIQTTFREECIRPLWHIIIYYLYVFLLMICSVALAYFSKSINRRYRVTKSISFYIYTQIIVVSVGGILQYLSEINHWPTYVQNLIFCLSQLLLLLGCILFIFMPPMIPFLSNKCCSKTKKQFFEHEGIGRQFSKSFHNVTFKMTDK